MKSNQNNREGKISNSFRSVCENCSGELFIHVFSGGDKYFSLGGEFDIRRCEECGLFQITPKLSQEVINQYYLDNYMCFLSAIEDEPKILPKIDRNRGIEKRCRKVIRQKKDEGRIIDIGCATGNFLKGMKDHGWECLGVEPNKKAANYAQERFGLEILPGYLPQSQLHDNSFDVVSIWDVIEHVYDPHEFLSEIFRILKPGGLIIGSTPNANSMERFIFGQYWAGWEVPRHYRCYTPDTLISLLKKNYFEKIKIFSFIGRHGVFMLSLDFWINANSPPTWFKEFIRAIMGSIIIRILLLPVFLFLEICNWSTVMSFSAKKSTEFHNNPK